MALLGALFGAQGENPAYGAETPGDVPFTYKGDPSEAIAKYGTQNKFKPQPFIGRLLGKPDYNAELSLSKAQAEQAAIIQKDLERFRKKLNLENIPEEAQAKAQSELASKRTVRADTLSRMAPTIQRMSGQGLVPDLGLPTPLDTGSNVGAQIAAEELLNRYGEDALSKGLYPSLGAGEQELNRFVSSRAARPGLPEETLAAQKAALAQNALSALVNSQTKGFRESNPELVNKSLTAEFLTPSLNAQRLEAELPWAKGKEIGGVYFTDPSLRSFVSATPAIRGGEPVGATKEGQPIYSQPQAPMPVVVREGMAIRPKPETLAPPQPSPAPAPTTAPQTLTPSLNLGMPPGFGGVMGSGVNRIAEIVAPLIYGKPLQPSYSTNVPPTAPIQAPNQPSLEDILKRQAEEKRRRELFGIGY